MVWIQAVVVGVVEAARRVFILHGKLTGFAHERTPQRRKFSVQDESLSGNGQREQKESQKM